MYQQDRLTWDEVMMIMMTLQSIQATIRMHVNNYKNMSGMRRAWVSLSLCKQHESYDQGRDFLGSLTSGT